jgi:transcriptional regulator with XRE-family HTH domain
VTVSTDEVARQLRALGLSERSLARELGLSASAARKLMTPGRTVLRETAARALEYAGASPTGASSASVEVSD